MDLGCIFWEEHRWEGRRGGEEEEGGGNLRREEVRRVEENETRPSLARFRSKSTVRRSKGERGAKKVIDEKTVGPRASMLREEEGEERENRNRRVRCVQLSLSRPPQARTRLCRTHT